jgi:DnaJ family protein C protein 11
MPLFPPPFTASWSRRLFRNCFTEGNITVHTGPRPRVSFNIISPTAFNFTMDRHIERPQPSQTAGSVSGFAVGTQEWTYGATLAGLNSSLSAGIAYTFTELALQAKLGIEWGFTGLALMLTGTWQNESSEFAASVGLNYQGVLMKLECDCPVSDILPRSAYELWCAVSRICSSDSQCQ